MAVNINGGELGIFETKLDRKYRGPGVFDAAHDSRGFPQVRHFAEDDIRTMVGIDGHPKATGVDPKEFFDNHFIKELEDSGFIKELYGQR